MDRVDQPDHVVMAFYSDKF